MDVGYEKKSRKCLQGLKAEQLEEQNCKPHSLRREEWAWRGEQISSGQVEFKVLIGHWKYKVVVKGSGLIYKHKFGSHQHEESSWLIFKSGGNLETG